MRRSGILVAVCAVVGSLAAAATGGPQPTAFQLRLGTRVSAPLTDTAGNALLAHVSPDGQHEVAWSGGTLTVSSTNGVVSRTVAQVTGDILFAAWSPNDRLLAFEVLDGGRFSIWVARVDGHGYQLVRAGAAQPAWAPDSHQLAFVDGFDAATFTGSLATAATDGTGLRELTPRGGVFAPEWSPDGRWIVYAFTEREHGGRHVLLAATDGSGTRVDLGSGDNAEWSPDSHHLAIVRHAPHRHQTLVVATLGSANVVRLVHAHELDAVAWSHQGTWLAYAAKRTSREMITVARADGSFRTAYAPPSRWAHGEIVSLAWSKDDRTLYYSMRVDALKRRG